LAGRPRAKQAEGFTPLLRTAAPDTEQHQDLDFRLVIGQLFARPP